MMTYLESADGLKITRARAYEELQSHGVAAEWQDFLTDMGDKEEYEAQDVLGWLGY